MFERFTSDANEATKIAAATASYAGTSITPTHMLYGLAQVDGISARVLSSLGIDPRAIANLIPAQPPTILVGQHTPAAKKVLEFGFRQALRLGSSRINSGHLLLGTLHDDTELPSVWTRLGVSPEAVRETAIRFINERSAEEEANLQVAAEIRKARQARIDAERLGDTPFTIGEVRRILADTLRARSVHPALAREMTVVYPRLSLGDAGQLVTQYLEALRIPSRGPLDFEVCIIESEALAELRILLTRSQILERLNPELTRAVRMFALRCADERQRRIMGYS